MVGIVIRFLLGLVTKGKSMLPSAGILLGLGMYLYMSYQINSLENQVTNLRLEIQTKQLLLESKDVKITELRKSIQIQNKEIAKLAIDKQGLSKKLKRTTKDLEDKLRALQAPSKGSSCQDGLNYLESLFEVL